MLSSRLAKCLMTISTRTSTILSCQSRIVTFVSLTSIDESNGSLFSYNRSKSRSNFLNINKSTNAPESDKTLNNSETPEKDVKVAKITPLTSDTARALVESLSENDKNLIITAIHEGDAIIQKKIYMDQLAKHRWRSKFGRPSQIAPKLGDVDPTGTFCPVPDEWLNTKSHNTTRPENSVLFHLIITNSIPFIGFGFLDNFIMIVAGDSIDHVVGSYICISTMAAAALGNTFSDVVGIGSAYYVEKFAEKIGFQPPKLSPYQLDMPVCRRASNLGRVVGITIGCLLGMLPLLFIKDEPKVKPEKKD